MNSMDIGPYGDIFTCIGARVSAGNVRQESLVKIWTESPVWEETTNLNLANLPVCSTCELRQFCVRCHGTAAFEDGDMLGCSSVAYREARLRRQAYLSNSKDGQNGTH
jgi:radical SAM protein with 4Fe4S-binding SPASM domain